MNASVLQADQLSCQRGERLLWQNIQFQLPQGQLLQVAGANGAGKTSLLRILAGLARAESGSVTWQGVCIHQQKSFYQQQLHYLGHQTAVKNELTVWENCRLNPNDCHAELLAQTIKKMGLATHAEHFGYQLSQGQKQRVALVRLLLSTAPIWIVDEPFTALDADIMADIQTAFAQKLQQGGIIILTTHRPLTLPALMAHTTVLPLE